MIAQQDVLLLLATVYQSDLQPVPVDRFRISFGRRDMPEAVAALSNGLDGFAGRRVSA
jgi:hypothetical protein